jgi:hypothetical protein
MLKRLSLILLLVIPMLAQAQSWQAQSGASQTAVLELFSAEGCGLCPPAYQWVESFPAKGLTQQQVIVLSFHVDFLDQQKAWVDRFASPRFTERQRQIARLNLYDTIYTPEIAISGEVVHNWRQHGEQVMRLVNGIKPDADIRLHAELLDNLLTLNSEVQVRGAENQQNAKLYLAVTEDNIRSEVKGGDNAGKSFVHQHTVRRWLGPFTLEPTGNSTVTHSMKIPAEWQRNQLSVVAVVQNLNDAFILQGLALPLKD